LKELSFFDGTFIQTNEKKVCIEDRGYQFGDGIYEATHVYNGKCFALERHLKRCRRSMRELRIPITYMDEELRAIHEDIIQKSQIKDGSIYFQITRCTAPRVHYFPEKVIPHLSMTMRQSDIHSDWQETGIHAVLSEDIRWLRCDIKTINLLGNVLAKQHAHEKDAQEAVLFRKETNLITEGSSSNLFIVKDEVLWTHPINNFILKGVTRSILLEECAPQLGLPVVEKAFSPQFALSADEMFVTSTSMEVTPIISLEGTTIGKGTPGKVTQKLLQAYHVLVKKECY
jgi:D-alanine transaminase